MPEKFSATHLTAEQYLMHMAEHLRSRMSTLSKGTLQKVGVIQALLIMPDVLLLDEPLSGQDVDAQRVFVEKVNDLRGLCREEEDVRQQAVAELTKMAGGEILPYGDGYQIYLTQAECDRHLGRLLAQGWRLRGLYKV